MVPLLGLLIVLPVFSQSQTALPSPVRAVWDADQAYRETTGTRERVCINGLWRWQPTAPIEQSVPVEGWGFFKVPGAWPGITDYWQKDCQTVFSHPEWQDTDLGRIEAAWYQRTISVPSNWANRRVTLYAEYVNSVAIVHLDGERIGVIRFPAGEIDLTTACDPGSEHVLSLLVLAVPLTGVMLSYTDSADVKEVQGTVQRRGLCGDLYLASAPSDARITEVKIDPSVREGEIRFDIALAGLTKNRHYVLSVDLSEAGHSLGKLARRPFTNDELIDGRISYSAKWGPEKLWDVHTPQNLYEGQVSLLDLESTVLDVAHPVRFGFREFWTEGRDFYLNGTRIYLSAVPLDNALAGAAWATYEGARESLERLKSFGINFVYTHNYGCEPGSHLSFTEVLRAADDVGMLVALSQPHFSQYEWNRRAPDNGYREHAAFYVRAAQNHPSVVAYAMSHNATGYGEDMNPDMIDGLQDARDSWSRNNMRQAVQAEAIVKKLDSSRLIYHHASGNLGPLHTINFYPNFTPIQELSDWFEHWATQGVKPLFLCEYGAPFSWDWTMYRGWYKGQREFGSAPVPWEFCLAEWNAQFLGSEAYQLSEMEKTNLRWEAKQFGMGRVWHRWDYPHRVSSSEFREREPIQAMYITDNWRSFRTWGVSATSPWEYDVFWRPRDDVERGRRELPVNWERLQQPGYSPDYLQERCERMDLAFERTDWVPTMAAEALIRNNRPVLAYVGGKPARFTSKDHNFNPGDSFEKQLIVINNSRETVSCDWKWVLNLPQPATGRRNVVVPTGQQERIPVSFDLPATLSPGLYRLQVAARFSNGDVQEDFFDLNVLPRPPELQVAEPIALFDPRGETRELLARLGVPYQAVGSASDLSGYSTLIVGKEALTVRGRAPDISGVRDGLKVILFEQQTEVLEKRFGFRVAEYGLRRVFPCVAKHPLLDGLGEEALRDWRGAATILPPRLNYELSSLFKGAPVVEWCGIPVPRAWRCGNQGNVASALIEKPARGNFLPILHGGYSLQYSPLLEFREGQGLVLFCQVDVTGRTEPDPAADQLVRNIIEAVTTWKPAPVRRVVYTGHPDGKDHLQSAGFSPLSYESGRLSGSQILVVGPGSALEPSIVADFLRTGGNVLAVGLGAQEANSLFPSKVTMRSAEHISGYFETPAADSPLAGIGPADVHYREPRQVALLSGGATLVGDGLLAKVKNTNLIFFQGAPWEFDPTQQMNLKRTHRRLSYVLTRLLGNLGASSSTPLLDRFHRGGRAREKRWLNGFYLDVPEEWDDPYRFFRW